MEHTNSLVETIIKGIQEKNGHNIVVVNLSGIEGAICSHFVICQGSSPSQVDAIEESVSDYTREHAGEKPIKVIGKENSQWVAMDYEDVMVHIFLPDTREYYDLDHLWDDAELTVIPDIE